MAASRSATTPLTFTTGVDGDLLPVAGIADRRIEGDEPEGVVGVVLAGMQRREVGRVDQIGPKLSTVVVQFALLRSGPTFLAIVSNIFTNTHASSSSP